MSGLLELVLPDVAQRRVSGLELRLHAHFAGKRRHGEWFALDDGDLDEVRAVATCYAAERA